MRSVKRKSAQTKPGRPAKVSENNPGKSARVSDDEHPARTKAAAAVGVGRHEAAPILRAHVAVEELHVAATVRDAALAGMVRRVVQEGLTVLAQISIGAAVAEERAETFREAHGSIVGYLPRVWRHEIREAASILAAKVDATERRAAVTQALHVIAQKMTGHASEEQRKRLVALAADDETIRLLATYTDGRTKRGKSRTWQGIAAELARRAGIVSVDDADMKYLADDIKRLAGG